jgi:hypothetical protein
MVEIARCLRRQAILRPLKPSRIRLGLFFLYHHNAIDPAFAVEAKLHASPRSDQVWVNCPAILTDKADSLAEHVGDWLGVG